MTSIRLLDKARLELFDAVDFYDEAAFGLGERFLSAVEATFAGALEFPFSGAIAPQTLAA